MVFDTLRYDVVHHTNHGQRVHTPSLDELRTESVSFSRYFGEGLPTLQVRRALYTGVRSFPWRYPFGTEGPWPSSRGWHKIPPGLPTLAETLSGHGYKTALVSDLFHQFKPTLNFMRGWLNWEFVRGQEDDPWQGGKLDLVRAQAQRYVKGDFDPRHNEHAMLAQYLLNKREFSREDPLTSGTVFRKGMSWLERNHDDGPFALWLESFDPHEPWDPPREYADRYCPDFEGTEFLFPPLAARVGTEREKERTKALYYGEVTYIDECIGRLMNTLADLGRLDDTVVMVTSDHGTELLDHGVFGKRPFALYPHNTQLNWIVRHPQLPRRALAVDAFVQDHDFFPTVLDILGVAAPEWSAADAALAGRTVWPLIRAAAGQADGIGAAVERASDGRDHVITGYGDYASVRSAKWNYVVNIEQPDAEAPPSDVERPRENMRLYDLDTDPREQRNASSEHPLVVGDYRRLLERFLGQALPARLPARLPDRYARARPLRPYNAFAIARGSGRE